MGKYIAKFVLKSRAFKLKIKSLIKLKLRKLTRFKPFLIIGENFK